MDNTKRVLVTGGTGFLGSYVIKELIAKNYRVRALRRAASKIPFYISAETWKDVDWFEGDMLDIVSLDEAMDRVDAVIHSAALVSYHQVDKERMYHVNVQGTANIVNMALEKNVGRLVHVSSVAALGRTRERSHVDENKKWQPNKNNTPYGTSKYRSEMEVWRAIGEGLSGVIMNPSTIIGYGDWNTSSCRIFKSIYDGFPWYTTGINGFVDVEDVAAAAVLLMESDISGQRFIVNADNWSFQQLFNTIADSFGKPKPRFRATAFLGNLAWRMEAIKSFLAGRKPFLTKQNAIVAQSHTFFSNDKLLTAVPQFSFTPLGESIRKTCAKYLQSLQ